MSQIPALTWRDDDNQGRFGDGISRPSSKAKTKRFTLLVRSGAAAPMRVVTNAETASAAKRYMQARWPGAAVEVVK